VCYAAYSVTLAATVAAAAIMVSVAAKVVVVYVADAAATVIAAARCHVWLATVYTGAANNGGTYAQKAYSER
jgi:hypothetical protein